MKKNLIILSVFLLILGMTEQSMALLISGPDIIAAPGNVMDDLPGAENENQQAFNEVQHYLLTSDLRVDGRTTITSGVTVDSHMIFFNTPDNRFSKDFATWIFDGIILGIMSDFFGQLEAKSNVFLGASETIYPERFWARGLEGRDEYLVSGSSIDVYMEVSEPGDWIRVITQSVPVPEPATILLFGLGLLGLAKVRRRKKSNLI